MRHGNCCEGKIADPVRLTSSDLSWMRENNNLIRQTKQKKVSSEQFKLYTKQKKKHQELDYENFRLLSFTSDIRLQSTMWKN